MREDIFWTKIRVTYGDGSVFEGNEINVALVSGYTGKERGGEVRREYLERLDPAGECGTSRWKGEGTSVERLEVIARDIRQRLEDNRVPVTVDFVVGKLLDMVGCQSVDPSPFILGTKELKYEGASLSEVVAYMNWRGI